MACWVNFIIFINFSWISCDLVNQATNVGETIYMNCTQPDSLSYSWEFYYASNLKTSISGNDYPFSLSSDSSVLKINASTYGYGTYYKCTQTDIVFQQNSFYAANIYLGGELICSLSNTEVDVNNLIEVSCNDSRNGPDTPIFKCYEVNGDGALTISNVTNKYEEIKENNTYASVSYEYTINTFSSFGFMTAKPGVGIPEAQIQCEVKFDTGPVYSDKTYAAKNVPSYNSTWTSPPITIYYPPQDMNTSLNSSTIYVGDIVTCYANANPAATFIWREIHPDNITISTNATFVATSDLAGTKTYECIASNEVGGEQRNANVTGNITIYSEDACSSNPCENGGTCVNGNTCSCPDGYSGDTCQNNDLLVGVIVIVSLLCAAVLGVCVYIGVVYYKKSKVFGAMS